MRSLGWLLVLTVVAAAAACGGDDDGSSGGGEAPEISMIAWTQATGCVGGTASAVTVVVTATDADTEAANLTYSGSVTSCTGMITAATSMVTCPQLSTYMGTIRVADPEGNMDSLQISIMPCANGSAP
jgi:hypothetical protein